MIGRLLLNYDKMLGEAVKLGLPSGDIEAFANCYSPLIDHDPTRAERAACKRVLAALQNSPEAKLAMAKTRRDICQISLKPNGNAELHVYPSGFIHDEDSASYDPNVHPDHRLWAIAPRNERRKSLAVKTDSSVGTLISGKEAFRLYARFRNFNDPKKVYRNIGNGYPLDFFDDVPDKTRKANLRIDYGDGAPAFLFVGNRIPDACNEALAYASSRYCGWKNQEDLRMLMKQRAGNFAVDHITNQNHVEWAETLAKLEQEISELEKQFGKS